MPARIFVLMACFIFIISACSPYNDHVSIEMSQATYYTDIPVKKLDKAKVSLRPKAAPSKAPTAIMLPLRMRQNMAKGYLVAGEISRVFWTTWLDAEVFPAFEYIEENRLQISRSGDAAAFARSIGADLAVYGEVSYLLSGGTVGDTQLALRVQIVDAASGQLLWIIEDSGMMSKQAEQDWLFMKHRGRMADDPLYAVANALAADMAVPVKSWSRGTYGSNSSPRGGQKTDISAGGLEDPAPGTAPAEGGLPAQASDGATDLPEEPID